MSNFSELEQAVLDLKQKLDNERTIRTESEANRMTLENQVMVGLVFLFSNQAFQVNKERVPGTFTQLKSVV